ncbi:MAG: hypothetical protein CVT48_01360 [Thermoplasmata archaeon HGW-Thermoplasmata-1]|nr:MAG: hypothetical protein CVT48_01360 [Thermoplasmata archaeon HGW-Thermoplasmata-1]
MTLETLLGKIVLGSAHRPKAVIAVVVAITLIAGAGIGIFGFVYNSDVQTGFFESYNPQAKALKEAFSKIPGVNSEFLYFELDPEKTDIGNITDYEAILAVDELFNYIADRVPEVTGMLSLPHLVKLINDANFGNDFTGRAFEIPDNEQQFQIDYEILWTASQDDVLKFCNKDFSGGLAYILYVPGETQLDSQDIAHRIRGAIADYLADDSIEYNLFNEKYTDSWGTQSWLAALNEAMVKENVVFFPICIAFILACLFVAFRNFSRALLGLCSLLIGVTWSFGFMAYFKIPIGAWSASVVPLLLGVGVDYSIHMINEYEVLTAKGEAKKKIFEDMGRLAAVALVIATITTLSGLAIMVASTAPMVMEMGVIALFGISAICVLSITFVPACLSLSRKKGRVIFKPSNLMARVAHGIVKHRAITIPFVVILTIAAAILAPTVEPCQDSTLRNLPSPSHMSDMYMRMAEDNHIGASGNEIFMCKGDICDPVIMRDLIRLMTSLHENSEHITPDRVLGLPAMLDMYESLKEGTVVLVGGMAIGTATGAGNYSNIPDSREGIKQSLDEMMANPAWEPMASLFVDKDYTMSMIQFSPNLPPSYESARTSYFDSEEAIERAGTEKVDTYMIGTQMGLYMFMQTSYKWMFWGSVGSFAAVVLLVFVFTRSWKAVVAAGTPMAVAMGCWYGALALFGLTFSIVFMLSLAFITSMGADYAVHLIWHIKKTGNAHETFRTTGKAVLFSAITTAGSFIAFTFSSILGVYEFFEACILAIVIIFVVTMLVLPHFYKKELNATDPKLHPALGENGEPREAVEVKKAKAA